MPFRSTIAEVVALGDSAENMRKLDIHNADLSAADYEDAIVQVLQPAHKTAAELQRSLLEGEPKVSADDASNDEALLQAIDIAPTALNGELVEPPDEVTTVRIPAEVFIYPDETCWACGQTACWTKKSGDRVCGICHPVLRD